MQAWCKSKTERNPLFPWCSLWSSKNEENRQEKEWGRTSCMYFMIKKKNKKKTELLSVGRAGDFREEDRDIHCGKHFNRGIICKSVPSELQLLCLITIFTTVAVWERSIWTKYSGGGVWHLRETYILCKAPMFSIKSSIKHTVALYKAVRGGDTSKCSGLSQSHAT